MSGSIAACFASWVSGLPVTAVGCHQKPNPPSPKPTRSLLPRPPPAYELPRAGIAVVRVVSLPAKGEIPGQAALDRKYDRQATPLQTTGDGANMDTKEEH